MCDEEKPPCKRMTTLHKYKTEYNADSVEWCPHEPHQNIFVCANYQLKHNAPTGKSERVGVILLFSSIEGELKLHQTVCTAAVLDQKWCHNRINGASVLGVVNAHRTLEVYKLNSENVQLELMTKFHVDGDNDHETLLLSLDWSTGKHQTNEPEVLCSDSRGDVHRFKFSESGLEQEGSCHSHDFEAWIVGFYYWDPNVFFSGGDDSRFLKYDKRLGLQPVSRNLSHEAGVTSVHSNCEKEYVVATGSYDMRVRLWDIRSMKSCITSIKMPGTLWRLKWDPFFRSHLLAACMLGGIHVIQADFSKIEIIDSYYEHTDICYGADWSFVPLPEGKAMIASCSFYDNLLCVSEIGIDH